MAVYTVHQAKTQLSRLIAAAEAGEEVVIARRDKPAVRLVADQAKDRPIRRPGRFKGVLHVPDSFFDPLPEEELRLWEGHED